MEATVIYVPLLVLQSSSPLAVASGGEVVGTQNLNLESGQASALPTELSGLEKVDGWG